MGGREFPNVRYDGDSLERINTYVQSGAGPQGVAKAAEPLRELAEAFRRSDEGIRSALKPLGVEWTGTASEQLSIAAMGLDALLLMATDPVSASGAAAEEAAQAFATTRNRIPKSQPFQPSAAAALPIVGPAALANDVRAWAEQRKEDTEAARAAMNAWQNAALSAIRSMQPMDPPPPITLDVEQIDTPGGRIEGNWARAESLHVPVQTARGPSSSDSTVVPAGEPAPAAPTPVPPATQPPAPTPSSTAPQFSPTPTPTSPVAPAPGPQPAGPGNPGLVLPPTVPGGEGGRVPLAGTGRRAGVPSTGETGGTGGRSSGPGAQPSERPAGPWMARPGGQPAATAGGAMAGGRSAGAEAGRGGTAGTGRGGSGFMAPAGGANGDDDVEHSDRYWVDDDELFYDERQVAPPVIGEDRRK